MSHQVLIYTQAYSAERTIGRAIESVLSQDFCGLDPLYVVVNNGSTDSTGEIINQYARGCSWIHPVHLDSPMTAASVYVLSNMWQLIKDGYFFYLDADDEYCSDFFESMYGFILDHDLDMATCGVDLVDQATNEIIGGRSVESNLIIEREEFADMYIHYRRFFMERWGKLYRLRLVKEWYAKVKKGLWRPTVDFEYTFDMLALAKRVGVFSRKLHRYYRSSSSQSMTFHGENLAALPAHMGIMRDWLRRFGEISTFNEDYLAAVYLGWCENQMNLLDATELPKQQKAHYLAQLFSFDETKKVLLRDNCDPQFRNLAAREAFIDRARERMLAYSGDEKLLPGFILV